jgi:hypothetical protein
MSQVIHNAMKWVYSLDPQSTLLVLLGALVLGFLCLRGFGSRNTY